MGTCRIASESGDAFLDRAEAGRCLAHSLEDLRGRGVVVLGIPRGGVVVARELALALGADLDIVLARKLGAPGNPELAIGAVTEDGGTFVDQRIASMVGADQAYVEGETARQLDEIARRAERYRAVRAKVPLAGRSVVVTDDGVATGATMRAALWAVRHEQPAHLTAALPVGPPDAVRSLAEDADDLLCLRAPEHFSAVGQFYVRFDQTREEDLIGMLREASNRKGDKQ